MAAENILLPEPFKLPDVGPGAFPTVNIPPPPPTQLPLQAPKFDPVAAKNARQNNLVTMRAESPTQVINPYQLGKDQIFGAGLKYHQFERYYEHPKFDKLGFSPFRDNETFYNKHSSGWDDFRRAAGEWGTLTSLGLKDAFGFGSIVDPAAAREYEKAMAIGSSTRGGVTGFANNLFLNSGYTVGIMSEMILEELALVLGTFATGGMAGAITVPAMARAGLKGISKISTGLKAGSNIMKGLENLSDVNKARQYFNAAGVNAFKFINPLEQTTTFARNVNKLENLDNLKKVSTGVGAFYRDVRNLRLVYGESALEGGFVQNTVAEELLAEHYKKHPDRPPTKAEADAIVQTSTAAGLSTSQWNMPVIFLSNKLVFNTMFKAFSPIRRLTTDVIAQNTAGKIIQTGARKSPYAIVETGLKGRIKSLKNFKGYPGSFINYTKANIAEGLQESFQEVIAGASTQYYMDQYGSATRGGVYNYIGANIEKQFSSEGAEIFFSGFLMGGVVQGPQRAVSKVTDVVSAGGYKNYKTQVAEGKKALAAKVEVLNTYYNDIAKYHSLSITNLVNQEAYQKGMSEADKNNDAKGYYDFKDAAQREHVITAIQMGVMDGFYERLESFKDLTAAEFKEAFPGHTQDRNFNASIDDAIKRAKNVETRYKELIKIAPNRVNPHQFKPNSPEFEAAMADKVAYDEAIKEAVFSQDAFDRTLQRIVSTQSEIQGDAALSNASLQDFNALFTFTHTEKEISNLEIEIGNFKGTVYSAEAGEFKKQKEQKLKRLKAFAEARKEYTVAKSLAINNTLEGADKSKVEKEFKVATKKLFKAYNSYLKNIASVSKDHVFDVNVEKSFQKLLDVYELQEDTTRLVGIINTLTDPTNFRATIARNKEMSKHFHDNRKAYIKDALERYQKTIDEKGFLNRLADANMFFDPDQLEDFFEKGIIPNKFFYIEAGKDGVNALDEVDMLSEDYQKAIDIAEEYVTHVIGKPVPQFESKKNPYATHQRGKAQGDKRTYNDYAKQFGFDPKAIETKLPLAQVLQSIIDSKFSTAREIALAQRLLLLARDGETVTFSKTLPVAGEYNKVSQSKVDARYSASDYNGTGIPLETNILRQEIHRHAVEALETDNAFKKEMQDLFNAATAFYNQPTEDGKPAIPQLGLSSLEAFVAETMISEKFQALLSQIPYAAAKKATVWTEFVNSIQRLLKRFFGKNATNTALNAAIDNITTKLDNRPDAPAGTSTAGTMTQTTSYGTSAGPGVTTSTESLDAKKADIEKRKKEAYAAITTNTESRSEEDWFHTFTEHPDFPELKGVTHRPAYGLEINGKIVDSLYKYIDAKYKAELDALEEEVAKKSLAPKGPQSIVPSTEVPITPATILSILYLDEPASEKLRNTILKGYKENNDHKVARGEVPFDVTWGKVKMTDEEILNSPSFKRYAGIYSFSSVKEGLKIYNQETGRTKNVEGAKAANKATPVIKTAAMISALAGLGYSPKDIEDLLPVEAQRLIDTGTEKGIGASLAEVKARLPITEKRTELNNKIASATMETYSDIKADIMNNIIGNTAALQTYKLPFESNRDVIALIEELLARKEKELAFNVNWYNIKEGDGLVVLIPNADGSTREINMIVDKVESVNIYLHQEGNVSVTTKVNMNEAATRLKLQYNPMTKESTESKEPISDDDAAFIKDKAKEYPESADAKTDLQNNIAKVKAGMTRAEILAEIERNKKHC